MMADEEDDREHKAIKKALKSVNKQNFFQKAMDTMGYVVHAKDGWIIKEYKDGTIEKIEKI